MNRMSIAAVAALVLTAAGLGGLYWMQQRGRTPAPEVAAPPVAEAPSAPAPAASEPGIRYPIDPSLAGSAPAPAPAGPGEAQSQWKQALVELLGQSAVVRFVYTEDFARRFVVTVDNLARAHAPPRMWPVQPTSGRFNVTGNGELRNIANENAGRYTPFVNMVTAIDARRAAVIYARMYPQLQQAYEEQGYPGRYFNDRVVAVIDHLLQTPEPPASGPLVQLTEVKGSVPSTQPWLRYEFADPELQSLSSGQRVLLRVGPAHRQALKAKLREFRAVLAQPPGTR
jgi:hypothetical protein